jgi:hypothetical protein
MLHYVKNGVLIDGNQFAKTTRRYYGDVTFEEAFKKTQRHVSINVSSPSGNSSSFKMVATATYPK